jgi:hypothetical protein
MTQTRNELHRTLKRQTFDFKLFKGTHGPTYDDETNAIWEVYLKQLQDMINAGDIEKAEIEKLLTEWLKPMTPGRISQAYNDTLTGKTDPRYPYCEYLKNNIEGKDELAAKKQSIVDIINEYSTANNIKPNKFQSEMIQANEILKNYNGPTNNNAENRIWKTRLEYLKNLSDKKAQDKQILDSIDEWLEPKITERSVKDHIKGKLDDRFIYIQYFMDNLQKSNDDDAQRLIRILEYYCESRNIPAPLNPPEDSEGPTTK